VSRTATATVYDQYGTGVANHAVVFTNAGTTGSTGTTDAFTDSTSRTTNSVGVATLSYTDVQTETAKMVTTATPSGVTAATSTYYRIDGTTPNFTEVDTTVDDGAVTGTSFQGATGTDIITFAANHGLTTGDEIIISTAPNDDGGVLVDNSEWYVVVLSATTATFHSTRTVSALGAVSYGTAADLDATVGGTSAGVVDANNGIVNASDREMEIVINDAANNRFIVENKLAAANFDYHAYTYDSGDQFNVYADGQGSNSSTPASMATFATHVAAKMSAVTGAPNAGFDQDIVSITYTNAAAGGGVSVFSLGS
jgi:hypothetical protein